LELEFGIGIWNLELEFGIQWFIRRNIKHYKYPSL
jgi:hypothetical protein